MIWNEFGDFINLDPDPYSSNFVDPDKINSDPRHWYWESYIGRLLNTDFNGFKAEDPEPIEEDPPNKLEEMEEIHEDDDEARSEATFRYLWKKHI